MIEQYRKKFLDSYNKLIKYGSEYADIKGKSWQAQELKSSVLAKVAKHYVDLDMPVSKAEIEARASKDFEDYVIMCAGLLKEELIAKAAYEAEKSRFETLRSLCSLEKATLKEIE